jgi:hypothetical protein
VALTKQKNFRLSAPEAKRMEREAREAGLTDSQWLRLIVRAALGETRLLEQLTRVVRGPQNHSRVKKPGVRGRG